MSDTRPLPEGWFSAQDSEGGTYFYKADGKTQWHHPLDPDPDADTSATETNGEAAVAEKPAESSDGYERPAGVQDEAQSMSTFHRDSTETSSATTSDTQVAVSAAPAESPAVSIAVPAEKPVAASTAKTDAKAPEFLDKLDKYVMGAVTKLKMLQFTGFLPFLFSFGIQLLWLTVEFVAAIVYLANTGLKNENIGSHADYHGGYFLPVWLLIDAIVGYGYLVVRYILLRKPSKFILANPPSILSTNPLWVFAFQTGIENLFWTIYLIVTVCCRIFMFIWSFIGLITLSVTARYFGGLLLTFWKVEDEFTQPELSYPYGLFDICSYTLLAYYANFGLELGTVVLLYLLRRVFATTKTATAQSAEKTPRV